MCFFNTKLNMKGKESMMLDLVESRLFGRVCYGYIREKNGLVSVNEEEEKVVKMIFELSLNGNSLEKIQSILLEKQILSCQVIQNGAELELLKYLAMINIYYME